MCNGSKTGENYSVCTTKADELPFTTREKGGGGARERATAMQPGSGSDIKINSKGLSLLKTIGQLYCRAGASDDFSNVGLVVARSHDLLKTISEVSEERIRYHLDRLTPRRGMEMIAAV